jgi:hypothetical protein
VVFGGFYGVASLPATQRPSVRVVFPCPRAASPCSCALTSGPDGSLRFTSPPGRFGQDGADLFVRSPGSDRGWARRVPLPERFRVFVDEAGGAALRPRLRLYRAEVIRLHYRLQRGAEVHPHLTVVTRARNAPPVPSSPYPSSPATIRHVRTWRPVVDQLLDQLCERLLAKAYLFDDPSAYEAGVRDALEQVSSDHELVAAARTA